MKVFRNIIISVLIIALLGFTAFFVIDAYNSGKIGNKAEKVAQDFETELLGTWEGSYSISGLTFADEGKVTLTMLGISLDGNYTDNYNLETEIHTLTINYNSSLGISITRKFNARISDDKLTLTDVDAPSIVLNYKSANVDAGNTGNSESTTQKGEETTAIYNPGIDVFKANLLGKWKITTGLDSGYDFVDSSKVTVSLLGVKYDGTYSVTVEDSTGKYAITIDYAQIAGINISNTYYAGIDGDNMILAQKGAESITSSYTRVVEN